MSKQDPTRVVQVALLLRMAAQVAQVVLLPKKANRAVQVALLLRMAHQMALEHQLFLVLLKVPRVVQVVLPL
jgi:hypothetical protein